jgi:hypothetical protein
MDELFKSFNEFKNYQNQKQEQEQEQDKLSYIKVLENKSTLTITKEEQQKYNFSDDEEDKDELSKFKDSFFSDYNELDYKKNKKNKELNEKNDFIKNVIIEEENCINTNINLITNFSDNDEELQYDELNPKDNYYYDRKARRKFHRNKKKNYGNFIYDNNIYQLKNFNHLDKKTTIDIYNEQYSESDGYDEEYSITREQFNEKKKHLRENKIFYNILPEYINNHKELFTMSILEQVNSYENDDKNITESQDFINNNDDNETDLTDSNADVFEDIDSEVIDKLIEFEYQKCLGVLDLVIQYSDSKDIKYDKEFLIEKLKGFMIVMKPYCLNYHNFLGYLKIKDGELKLVTGTFIKYMENNRLLISKDFQYMFSMNPVRLLFKKIRIEDITEWIYGSDT